MTDLATLQSRLDALRASRATGVLSVRHVTDGVEQQVTYKSDSDMASAAAALEAEIASASGTRPVRTIVVRNSGGW